jgi:hypothetical protein
MLGKIENRPDAERRADYMRTREEGTIASSRQEKNIGAIRSRKKLKFNATVKKKRFILR